MGNSAKPSGTIVVPDTEIRKLSAVHIIKDELGKLGKDFQRFDARMKKLADHIRLAHQDAEEVRVSSDKITKRFSQIERVELDQPDHIRSLEQELLDAPQEEEAGREEPRS